MTFLNYADITASPFKWINMYNQAGNLVTPSTASVLSAIDDNIDYFNDGNFTVEIYDANGTNSWPMAYMSYVSVNRNYQLFDCTNIQELVNFFAWILTNNAYAFQSYSLSLSDTYGAHVLTMMSSAQQAATKLKIAPTDITLAKVIIDAMRGVQCNNEPIFTTSFLIGGGTPLPLLTSWAVARSSASSKVKYYSSTSDGVKPLVQDYNLDFGVVGNALSSTWYARMPDVALVPITAFSIAACTS